MYAKERWLKKMHTLLHYSLLLFCRHRWNLCTQAVSTTSLFFRSFHKNFLCHKACKNTYSNQALIVLRLQAIILTVRSFPYAFLPIVHTYCSVLDTDPIVLCLYLAHSNKACLFLWTTVRWVWKRKKIFRIIWVTNYHIFVTSMLLFPSAWSTFAYLVHLILCKTSILEQYRKYCDLWCRTNLV